MSPRLVPAGGPDTATIPPGRRMGRTAGRRRSGDPAHLMTAASNTPARSGTRDSSLRSTTLAPRSPSSLTTALRNDARRCRDSRSVTSILGLTILIGIPGKPAPDPTSMIVLAPTGKTLRKRRLSAIRAEAIQAGSADATSRWVFCHFSNISRYLVICSSSGASNGRPSAAQQGPDSTSAGDELIISRSGMTRCDAASRQRHDSPSSKRRRAVARSPPQAQARLTSLAARPARSVRGRSMYHCCPICSTLEMVQ